MIKPFGCFALFVFLVLCARIGGFDPGFAVWFLSVMLVLAGSAAFALLQFPLELEKGTLGRLLEFSRKDHLKMVALIEDIAQTARKDGLLAVEAAIRDVQDPLLKYLLRKTLGGFDKVQLGAIIRHQLHRTQELFAILQNYVERLLQAIPVVGLIGSLFQIMDFLVTGKGSIGVVFVPFLLGLLLQLLLQSFAQERVIRSLDSSRLYYLVLEEGVQGIQDGISPELLRDKLESRLSDQVRWADR